MGDTAPTSEVPAAEKVETEGRTCCGKLGLDKEVRHQRYAVVSVLTDGQEPAVCVYAAHESEEKARHYIEDTLSKQITTHHLNVVPMYEWIHLDKSTVDHDDIPRKYRNPQLDSIMQAKHNQHRQVEQYMQHCEEIGEKPKIKEIELPPPPAAEASVEEGGADIE